jgi:alginate O-acetyltransferase complex protein AlgI
MVFTSTTFVFFFLPLSLIAFYVFPARWRSIPLLAASAAFYAWGEPVLVVLVAATSVVTYVWGRWLARAQAGRRWILAVGLLVVLGPLVYLKYATFIADAIGLDQWAESTTLILPIGVSFYTFMAIGYLVDVYRDPHNKAPRLLDFAAYLMMFPHLVAGPIVRWTHVGDQLRAPRFRSGMFGFGAVLVATGLFKKAVLADSLAPLVDDLFGAGEPASIGGAWLAAIMYSLQIYLDFSAYSDIAIGLAAMLGIHFHENFRFPYRSRSAREFWQRWHISLGSWFRDYLYFPLGGSRARPVVVWRNLLIVWALTGLWHGAAWTFVLWGLYFGVLIGLERFVWGTALERLPRPFQHLYGILVAVLGWVLFRSVDLEQAGAYYSTMFGAAGAPGWDSTADLAWQQAWVLIAVCAILAAGVADPLMSRLRRRSMPPADPAQGGHVDTSVEPAEPMTVASSLVMVVIVVVALAIATAYMVSVSYSPFIYFRF